MIAVGGKAAAAQKIESLVLHFLARQAQVDGGFRERGKEIMMGDEYAGHAEREKDRRP